MLLKPPQNAVKVFGNYTCSQGLPEGLVLQEIVTPVEPFSSSTAAYSCEMPIPAAATQSLLPIKLLLFAAPTKMTAEIWHYSCSQGFWRSGTAGNCNTCGNCH